MSVVDDSPPRRSIGMSHSAARKLAVLVAAAWQALGDRVLWAVFMALLGFLFSPADCPEVYAETYVVAPNGTDTNVGTFGRTTAIAPNGEIVGE